MVAPWTGSEPSCDRGIACFMGRWDVAEDKMICSRRSTAKSMRMDSPETWVCVTMSTTSGVALLLSLCEGYHVTARTCTRACSVNSTDHSKLAKLETWSALIAKSPLKSIY